MIAPKARIFLLCSLLITFFVALSHHYGFAIKTTTLEQSYTISSWIHQYVAFAAALANATGRTIIWPDSVGLIQKRIRSEKKRDFLNFEYVERFPGVRTISFASAQAAGISELENRYLENREVQLDFNATDALEGVVFLAGAALLGEDGVAALERKMLSRHKDVVVLDFSDLNEKEWWKVLGVLFSKGEKILETISGVAQHSILAKAKIKEYSWEMLKMSMNLNEMRALRKRPSPLEGLQISSIINARNPLGPIPPRQILKAPFFGRTNP
ncbi:hypothetical protein B0J14DRAFT_560948 [Halenospora varia]|nr:hypothetical protein B0J14DRAFT_560948 [Halenospora varia]